MRGVSAKIHTNEIGEINTVNRPSAVLWIASLAIFFSCVPISMAQSRPFLVKEIEMVGTNRVDDGVILEAITLRDGDIFDENDSAALIKEVFALGLFADVSLYRTNDTLVIKVVEYPGIKSVELSGFLAIDTDDDLFRDSLEETGVAPGKIFSRTALAYVKEGLRRRYFATGKYNAKISTRVEDVDNSQVAIFIDVVEGETVILRRLRLHGNKSFDFDAISEGFFLREVPWYKFWSSEDEYSKSKLDHDLEQIRNFYLDRGYLAFQILDATVSLTHDNLYMDIDIFVEEGLRYRVRDISIAFVGERDLAQKKIIRSKIQLKRGDIFSRSLALQSTQGIGAFLRSEGYPFAVVDLIQNLIDPLAQVDLVIFVDKKKLGYVRRINIIGNQFTDDQVFRRELRQLEGAVYSGDAIAASRRRLQRLPYVEGVEIRDVVLEGSDDLLDLDFILKEKPSGNLNFSAGYSDTAGPLLSVSLNQENFLGSGNGINLVFNNSKVNTQYSLQVVNPYFTDAGVSRVMRANFRRTDFTQAGVTNSNTEQLGAGIGFGIPVSEDDTLNLSLDVENIQLSCSGVTTSNSLSCFSTDLQDFIQRESDDYTNFIFGTSLVLDTRNSGFFPTEGQHTSLGLRVWTPGSDLNYYTLRYRQASHLSLNEEADWVFVPRFNVSFANTYLGTSEVPFYDRSYLGGTRNLRGYRRNSVGPKDSSGNAIGGDFLVASNFDLFFPTTQWHGNERLYFSLFMDVGNVYRDIGYFDVGELRASFGLYGRWLTALGALSFSFSSPLNDQVGDKTESFQFDLGASF